MRKDLKKSFYPGIFLYLTWNYTVSTPLYVLIPKYDLVKLSLNFWKLDWSPILMSHNSLIISQIQDKMMKQIGISYVWHNFTFATLATYLHFPQEQYLNVPIEESQYVSLRNFLFVNKMMQIGVSYVWHIGVTYFFCNVATYI